MTDDGHAVHYTAVTRGTPVLDSEGAQVGTVDEVVDNYDEHILDGIIFEDSDGRLRFVDGPEVGRTAERAVTLTITAAEAAQLPPPQKAPPRFSPGRSSGRLGKLFGGGWKKQ
jgi:sporulation protein YlmC with PRC-barrel domain